MKKKTLDLISFYTRAKLESDVFNNALGFFWWFIDPLISAGIYYFVFHMILHSGKEDYIPFLFLGLTVWRWFQVGVKGGCMSISNQATLYKKVYIPKIIFPWIELNCTTVKFLLAMVAILPIFWFLGYKITYLYMMLPVLVITQFIFILGITTFLASLTPYFPDFNLIISHGLRLLFYPSGILFSADRIPDNLMFLYKYNPMARSIEGFRNIIMYEKMPPIEGTLLVAVIGLITYLIGTMIIKKLDGEYGKIL